MLTIPSVHPTDSRLTMDTFKLSSAILITLFCWASAFIGIRIGLESYPPGALALFRFLVASLCMLPFYKRLPKQKIPWLVRGQLALIGFGAIGIYNICLNIGEMTVTAGIASFVIGLIPVFTICLSVLVLKTRPDYTVWLGIIVSFAGLVIIVLGENAGTSSATGVAIITISSLMGGFYNISQKRFLQHYHPIAVTAWVIWGGTTMLLMYLPELIYHLPAAKAHSTWAAIYMGIFPAALAYASWCFVLGKLPAARAALYLFALPLLSTLMGFIVLKEQPSLLSLTGGLIAMVGAYLASRSRMYQKKGAL